MILFSAFNTAQNMLSQIYSQKLNLPYLGNLTLIVAYFSFSISNFFIGKILEFISFKRGMFLASWGYVLFLAVGATACSCEENPDKFICSESWLVGINVFFALALGPLACMLWVSQIGYVSGSCDENSKNKFFGVFYALYELSQFLGSVVSAIVLQYFNHFGYFIILFGMSLVSTLMFTLLPNVEKTPEQRRKKPLAEKIKDFVDCLKKEEVQLFSCLCTFSGVVIGLYSGYFHKIISQSIRTEDDYVINQHTAYVFICLGLFEFIGGMLSSYFGDKINKYVMATGATLILEVGLFFTLVAYYEKSYFICFLAAGCWGMGDSILNSNITAILTTHLGNKIEYFAVFILWQEIGILIALIFSLGLEGYSQAFYFIFFSFFFVVANISIILMKKK